MLTLDKEECDKLQYIGERTQCSLEHVVKWALDAYFTIVFSDCENTV